MRRPIESLKLIQQQLNESGCTSDYDWHMYTHAFQLVLKKIKKQHKGTPKCKIANWTKEEVLRFLEEGSDKSLLSHYQSIVVNLYFDSKIEPKTKTSLGPVTLRCSYCDSTASIQTKNKVYVCDEGCDAQVTYHKGDLMPMGSLADPSLRRQRQAANIEIKAYVERSGYTLREAYARLAAEMKIQDHEVKIARLNATQCRTFLKIVRNLQDVKSHALVNCKTETSS